MDNISQNALCDVINELRLQSIGKLCGVSWQAVAKWRKHGLPRSEWTGETDYAERIARASNGRVTKRLLLEASLELKNKPGVA